MDLSSNSAVPFRTWSLVELGMDLERLKNSTKETQLTDDELQGALDRLDRVYDALLRFDLRNARDDYERDVSPLVREIRFYQRLDGLCQLDYYADEVKSHATQLLAVIERDASQRQAFLVRPAGGGFDPSAILLDPYTLFGLPGRVDPQLPRVCDYYLLEASRCFAADFSFAAAMLTATIVETLLQFYYKRLSEDNPVEPLKDNSWFRLEEYLKNNGTLNCPPTVPGASRRVRQLRNKIAHGDIEVVNEDAVEIFEAAKRAVKLMIVDLITRGKLQVVSPEAIQLGLEDVS